MTDSVEIMAGEICDDLDKLLSQLDSEHVDALSHLYVARRGLVEYPQRRPNQRAATAIAELVSVEDALKQATDSLSDAAASVEEDGIDELISRVQSHRGAIDASESKHVGWELKRVVEESSIARGSGAEETGLSGFERLR